MAETDSSNQTSTDNATILVVDDNPLIVGVLTKVLGSFGYKVLESCNGEDAIGVLEKNTVDLIVCDVMMPKMDGYRLQDTLRTSDKFAQIPFLFLSALGDQAEVSRGKELGADDYITKPFDCETLVSIIRGKLKRSRERIGVGEQKFDQYRKRIIHTLSHEFRTPLVAINTGAELLMERSEGLDHQKALNLLEAIKRGGERLERLVNDFMVLQQIEGGVANRLFDSRAAVYDINKLLSDLVESRGELYQSEKAKVTLQLAERALFVRAYEPQIQDIIDRLIQNGIKFSQSAPLILVRVLSKPQEVGIEVADRGIGLDPARVAEALNPFGQLDRDRYEQQGGGMGLAIASKYAAINGGRVVLTAREGGGTSAVLYLPEVRPPKSLASK